jgi:glycosyltransferase 2 family protein
MSVGSTESPDLERPPAGPGTVHRLLLRGHQLWVRSNARARQWQERPPRVVAVLRMVYVPLALLLIGYIGYDAAKKVDVASFRVWPLVFAYFAALVWWLALAFGWSALVTERVLRAPVVAWCKTQVARYLPGGIWAPVARAATVHGRIRDKAAAVAAENVIVLAVSVGVAALWATIHNPVWLPLAAVIVLPLFASRWLERRTKVTRAGAIRATGTYSVGYVAYGFMGILTQVAVSGIRHPTYPLYVAGAACLAWAAGLVVVFAPGGVGVREVVYIWMLGSLYPVADLQAAAVTARLVTVLAEMTVLAAVSLPVPRARRPLEHSA